MPVTEGAVSEAALKTMRALYRELCEDMNHVDTCDRGATCKRCKDIDLRWDNLEDR